MFQSRTTKVAGDRSAVTNCPTSEEEKHDSFEPMGRRLQRPVALQRGNEMPGGDTAGAVQAYFLESAVLEKKWSTQFLGLSLVMIKPCTV